MLASAVAAGQQRRVRQAVILKTLGATRAQIRAAWVVEFGALGLTAGVLAAGVGGLASWAVLRFLMHLPWVFLPGRLALGLLAALAMLLGFGYFGTARALRVPPALAAAQRMTEVSFRPRLKPGGRRRMLPGRVPPV